MSASGFPTTGGPMPVSWISQPTHNAGIKWRMPRKRHCGSTLITCSGEAVADLFPLSDFWGKDLTLVVGVSTCSWGPRKELTYAPTSNGIESLSRSGDDSHHLLTWLLGSPFSSAKDTKSNMRGLQWLPVGYVGGQTRPTTFPGEESLLR